MSAATQWWWVRHAPVPEAGGRILGSLDADCDISDQTSFGALAEILPRDAVWIVSPLRRTRMTLEAIRAFRPSLPEPLIEPALVEQSFGLWQGLTWPEMQAADPDVYDAFWRDPTRNAPPEGESFADQITRVGAAIARLTGDFAGRAIVAIAHGGTIRAAVARALSLPPPQAMAVVVDNLSLTRLDHLADELRPVTGGAWRVRCVNAPCRWLPDAGAC